MMEGDLTCMWPLSDSAGLLYSLVWTTGVRSDMDSGGGVV